VTNTNKIHIQLSHLLSLIPIGVAIGFLFGLLDAPLSEVNHTTSIIASLGTAILYGVAVYLAQSITKTMGLGYVHMASAIALLTIGVSNALYMIILASIIAIIIQYQEIHPSTNHSLNFHEITGWISISGITILAEYLIYTVIFNQSLPYTNLTVVSLFFVVITLGIGNGVSVFVGSIVTRQSFSQAVQQTIANHSPLYELLLIFVSAIIGVILYKVNELTFAIIISFAIAQIIYQYRTSQLKQESVNQLQELSTLNRVAQAVSVNLDLDDVLYNIYNEINQIVNASLIFIALYDDEHQRIHYPLVMKKGESTPWQQRHLTNGLTDYVIRNKQLLHIHKSDTNELKTMEIDVNLIESESYLGIPMVVGEKIIGVIGILNYHETDVLGTTNLNVLQSIVNQASLALRNARLYDRTTKLATNLSLINKSVQEVMFNLDHQESLHAAAKTAKTVTHADQIAIFLVNLQDTPAIQLAQSLGLSPPFKTKLENASPDWFTSNAEDYRSVYDVEDCDDSIIKELSHIGNFRAFAEIPMRSGNTIVGYLLIYHQHPHNYHSLEIDLLEMLTSQITVALDNTDLLLALELYASEQAELVHLTSISSSSLELEKVITDVSQLLRKMLKVTRVDIGLYMAGHEYIHIYMSQQSGHLAVNEYELQPYLEFQVKTDNMIRYPQIILLSDASISDNVRTYMRDHHCDMLTVVPMIINDEVIGIILISDVKERIFKDNERRLIEMATTQIAAQIHNAQIHTLTEEALVQRLEQLSLIEDIGQKISRSLDLDLIINNVLEAAMRSTQADLASIALIKNDTTVIVKQQTLQGGDLIVETYETTIETGIMGQTMLTGLMRVIDDNSNVKNYVPPPGDNTYRSSLVVPLSKGDTAMGALNMESMYPNFFTDEHAGFIKSLAGHAIISIDNANLLEQHQTQIEVLSQLRELALTASTTTSTDSIVNTIVHTATEMLKGSGGILIPYNHDRKEIESVSALGWIRLGSNFVQDMFFIPETLLYQVAHTEDMLIIEDVETHERYKTYEQRNHVNYTSLLIMPIKRRNQVTELLCVTFKKRRIVSEQDINSMQLLQVQVANHLENVQLSEEIIEQNVRMRAILDSTRDGIILLDREGNLQDANISAEELLNIDLNNYRETNFATILMKHSYSANDEESFAELIQTARILRTDANRNMIREYTLHSQAKLIYIREVSSPVWDASNEIVGRLLSLRDVTEERALDEFRDRLQSMILHDHKGPLGNTISGMVMGKGLLTEIKDKELAEDLTELMQVAEESSRNLMNLVEGMLDIGKMQHEQMDLSPISISIHEIAETAYTSLMASFRQANIRMTYDIPENLSDVYVDEDLIRRVLTNLIQNALKFTPTDGEIRVTAHIDTQRDDLIQVIVSDTGPGIPEKHRESIFGEFTTLDDETQKQQRGARGQGLGLTFCKLAVEEHGGQIRIADEGPLPGATFVFTLPTVMQRTTP
jgi:two-component system, NtrC family, sensor histidine kinase KinB